jgi:hypothetical protein
MLCLVLKVKLYIYIQNGAWIDSYSISDLIYFSDRTVGFIHGSQYIFNNQYITISGAR